MDHACADTRAARILQVVAKKELTIREVAAMGARARNAQLSPEQRKEASARANKERWAGLSSEERRAATAKARAARKRSAKKKRSRKK